MERQISLNHGFTDLEALLPDGWKEPRQNRAILVVAFEVQGLPASDYSEFIGCELKNVAVLFLKGRLSHRENVQVTQYWIDAAGRFNVVDPEPTKIVETPEGIFALFLSPYEVTLPTNKAELEARERIEVAQGLLCSFQGRNIVFRLAYENSYSLESRAASSWSEPLPVPLSLPRPVLTRDGIAAICGAERAIQKLSPRGRGRVQLSLRWLKEAVYDWGPLAFLKYWMAIETLAMPRSPDIRPLNVALQRAYSLPSASAAKIRFHTGLLASLRAAIVHRGYMGGIDGRLLVYLQCLHHDVLCETLGIPCGKRAGSVLDNGFDFAAYIRSLLSAARA